MEMKLFSNEENEEKKYNNNERKKKIVPRSSLISWQNVAFYAN